MDRKKGLFEQLDWTTPVRRTDWRYHWRVMVVGTLCTIPAIAIWHYLFPNTFWFIKLWNGGVTGGFVAVPVGYAWQLKDEKRRARSSGRYLAWSGVGLFFFALVSVFLWGPELHLQEVELAKIRGLSPSDVVAISIDMPNRPPRRIVDETSLVSFVNQCRKSDLFYPSHEGSTREFDLTIELADRTILGYSARVPERHLSDISLSFKAYFVFSGILIPDGAAWLDRVEKQ